MMTMADYDIGYGKPPLKSRFPKGNNANPAGRPKRKLEDLAAIVINVSSATTQYRERGRIKKATRRELSFRRTLKRALGGNLRSIEQVLKELIHAQRVRDPGNQIIEVRGWLPDYPGQTGEQKTREFAEQGEAQATEWWKPSKPDPTEEGS
jgi:Family of unknown function (DUF5681)